MNTNKTSLTLAIGAAFAATALSPLAQAADNPFGMQKLDSGYQLAAKHMAAADDKKMDGKCGGDKAKAKDGKCGGDKAKAKDGKCGGDKAKAKDGKCGAAKVDDKKKDGKCGEGKCGGATKK